MRTGSSIVCVAVVALLGAPASAAAVTPLAATEVSARVGVNTHVMYLDKTYADFDGTLAALRWLGVRQIRDGVRAWSNAPTAAEQRRRFAALAGAGIGMNLVAGRPDGATGTPAQLIPILRATPGVASIEGANEWDGFGPAGVWDNQVRAHQESLYKAVKADPVLRTTPVIGPSLARANNAATLGDVSAHLDYGGIHPYTGGARPEAIEEVGNWGLDTWVNGLAVTAPGKPIAATESGYHDAFGDPFAQPGITEEHGATYHARSILEHLRRGWRRTYIYELLDTEKASFQDANFGLFDSTLTPKPAATAVRNLLALISEAGPTGPPPAEMDVALSGPADLRSLVVSRSGGVVVVAVWRTARVWDRRAKTSLAVTPEPVAVTLGQPFATARAFTPVAGGAPVELGTNVARVDVSVGGDPVLVELSPTAPEAPGSAPVPALTTPAAAAGLSLRGLSAAGARGWRCTAAAKKAAKRPKRRGVAYVRRVGEKCPVASPPRFQEG